MTGQVPRYDDGTVRLFHGDCLDVLRTLPPDSVDSIVTDPPYGLANTTPAQVTDVIVRWAGGDREHVPGTLKGFMGNPWDAFVPPPAVWDECLRVLKPGGHMLVFAGARTSDLMGLSIRLAGFDMRDGLSTWVYGSGMPKSLAVSRAVDKIGADPGLLAEMAAALTAAREARGMTVKQCDALFCGSSTAWSWYEGRAKKGRVVVQPPNEERAGLIAATWPETAPVFDRMRRRGAFLGTRRHQRGGGTDDFGKVVGSKGTPRETDEYDHGTDAGREWAGWGTGLKPAHEPVIMARKPLSGTVAATVLEHGTGALNIDGCRVGGPDGFGGGRKASSGFASGYEGDGFVASTKGRWPANVMLDETAAAELDRQAPGASRFFFVAKAGKGERPVLPGVPVRADTCPECDDQRDAGLDPAGSDGWAAHVEAEHPMVETGPLRHDTVKPLALVRELVRLVTRPGGTVLDPFAGSGTTGEACAVEGFSCVLVEREAAYLPLIEHRLSKPVQQDLFGATG